MINKQKLWFLTLFSLILVLSVYYVTMPNDLLEIKNNEIDDSIVVSEISSDSISVLRNLSDESRYEEMEELRMILTNIDSTIEEKNNAYEQLKLIEEEKSKETEIENKIKSKFNLNSYVEIKNTQVKVVIDASEHSYELANSIINSVQEEFESKMYISVKFQW